PARLAAGGSLYVTRPTLGHYMQTRDELIGRTRELFSLVEQGKLKARVGHEYPLEQAGQAQADLEARKTSGKVLLTT
ncbi:MAG TPA: zinc-binding dehydrogenase, partial [Candidatus Elarobacter sp.]